MGIKHCRNALWTAQQTSMIFFTRCHRNLQKRDFSSSTEISQGAFTQNYSGGCGSGSGPLSTTTTIYYMDAQGVVVVEEFSDLIYRSSY